MPRMPRFFGDWGGVACHTFSPHQTAAIAKTSGGRVWRSPRCFAIAKNAENAFSETGCSRQQARPTL
eukprot:15461269-Alexandrium_andersonii.AAC.1